MFSLCKSNTMDTEHKQQIFVRTYDLTCSFNKAYLLYFSCKKNQVDRISIDTWLRHICLVFHWRMFGLVNWRIFFPLIVRNSSFDMITIPVKIRENHMRITWIKSIILHAYTCSIISHLPRQSWRNRLHYCAHNM